MNFRKLIAIAIYLSLVLLNVSCTGNQEAVVTFDTLYARPQDYSGQIITIDGYFFQGWETIVFSENLDYYLSSRKALAPGGRMMWVEGGIPKDIYDKLYEQASPGPTERFGKARVTGKFEYGGQYGHLGGFNARITPSKFELLEWTPPG